MINTFVIFLLLVVPCLLAGQSKVGAGNSHAEEIGGASALVQSAKTRLLKNLQQIRDAHLRESSIDALSNPKTCVAHRVALNAETKESLVANLLRESLVSESDGAAFPGGLTAGVFPPLLDEDSNCPHLPLSLAAAPGSAFGGHHSYPGGLALHELFNQQNALNLGANYRGLYGQTRRGLPTAAAPGQNADFSLNEDVLLAAPAWHDWAKMMVFQWNADGSEFAEMNIAGTGSHHIIGLAETMARGFSPLLVITQASAHAAPTLGNESKVIAWLRAAAILARVDPVAKGYLAKTAQGGWQLPLELSQRLEYQIHNLSDADFVESIPAVTSAQQILSRIAPQFGYDSADVGRYNNNFRNIVLAHLSPERLTLLYQSGGLASVVAEIAKLKQRSLL